MSASSRRYQYLTDLKLQQQRFEHCAAVARARSGHVVSLQSRLATRAALADAECTRLCVIADEMHEKQRVSVAALHRRRSVMVKQLERSHTAAAVTAAQAQSLALMCQSACIESDASTLLTAAVSVGHAGSYTRPQPSLASSPAPQAFAQHATMLRLLSCCGVSEVRRVMINAPFCCLLLFTGVRTGSPKRCRHQCVQSEASSSMRLTSLRALRALPYRLMVHAWRWHTVTTVSPCTHCQMASV